MIGGSLLAGGGAAFRLFAPDHPSATVVVDGRDTRLDPEGDGWFSGRVPDARAGSRYGFRLGAGPDLVPDVASRHQPDGPHGLSALLDHDAFPWTDAGWTGVALDDAVILEIHIGTFTPDGTYRAAADKLPLLKEAGITVVELMPVNDFPGRFGWGYDGVGWFAPVAVYGEPDDLKAFVDRAHALGLAVILDVVYNHLGPDGQMHRRYAESHFSRRYENEWGDPLNFDDDGSAGMRALVVESAAAWIRDYHLDGLRFDATQQIFDASPVHVVAEAAAACRIAAGGRELILVAENTPQDVAVIKPADAGGQALDGLWNEDFQRAARIAATGERDAYYSDLSGSAAELVAALRWGFLYHGQRSAWDKAPRGSWAFGTDLKRFVAFLENHDQVANSRTGDRLARIADRSLLRALTTLLLLSPQTPMLFQGQEFGSTRPFVFFCDHGGDLGQAVRAGRKGFLDQFPAVRHDAIPDPCAEATWRSCVLDWSERERNSAALALHRDLLALRRADPVFRRPLELAVSTPVPDLALMRWFGDDGDRLLVLNLGPGRTVETLPDPLSAPRPGRPWRMIFSSDDDVYDGRGAVPALDADGVWWLPGRSAVVLAG
ncbi:malto-oligosyltrehalose trehalohydrolase [Chthonobacter rhizosphaerae]|uniref:malto-oligosyltrehalose trehalohydrolase n=1 Tax=Chthonobacter rhizosphaerae TaxID=2735553 RepID=UPI0015EF30F8|nr:malto-oligosyltrehalose trehalohydrolase [Chthonobacter rhizosphaerae]